MAGCNEDGEQQKWWEMSVIMWEIWLWKREEVCLGVGKEKGCEEREVVYICVVLLSEKTIVTLFL